MMSDDAKKRPPYAKCSKCGATSTRVEVINQRCSHQTSRGQCAGVMGSMMSENDWRECPACNGSGCPQCHQIGYLAMRC